MASTDHPRTIDVLVDRIAANPELLARVKIDPVAVLTEVGSQIKTQYPPSSAATDRFTYRIAVVVLSLVVLLVALEVGVQWILTGGGETKVPELLISIGSTALGALAGLLMPTGGQH